jgi:hypothetical protein
MSNNDTPLFYAFLVYVETIGTIKMTRHPPRKRDFTSTHFNDDIRNDHFPKHFNHLQRKMSLCRIVICVITM